MAHINVAGASFTETADKCFWRVLLQGWATAFARYYRSYGKTSPPGQGLQYECYIWVKENNMMSYVTTFEQV